jgi:hypothetical protein
MKKLLYLLNKGQLCCYSAEGQVLEHLGVQQEKQLRTGLSVNNTLPGKIYQATNMANFISKPCKKIAEDLLKLSSHLLRMAVAFLTGHAPVRKHLYITARLMETLHADFAG